MKKCSPAHLFVIGLVALAFRCEAADLVNDTWNDGTRTDPAAPIYSEQGIDSDLDGNLESAWFRGGAGALNPLAPGGPLNGNGFGSSSASWYTYFTQPSTPVSLANAGDTLRVTLAFTPAGVNANNTSQGFNVALALTPNGSRVTSDASVPNAAYSGYAIFMNMGQTLGNSNPFQLREWTLSGSGALLGTSGNWGSNGVSGAGLANGATSGNHGYDDGTLYTLMMTLTRNGSGGLDITSTMSGGTLNGTGLASLSYTDTTPNGFQFDTFDIRPSSTTVTATNFNISQFRVETYSVPEPSSAWLLSAGLLLLPVFLRKR